MKKKVEYEYNLEKLSFKRLREIPSLQEKFIFFVTDSIKNNYDEIDENFAKRLIEIDNIGYDEYGFFTLGKDIWVCFYDDVPIGFEVITRKRGGSIKLGPTYLKPEYRGKGLASKMIEKLCTKYIEQGIRKVYVTAPINNYSTAVLDYKKLNMKLEAILCKNYSEKSSDRVCGRLFNNSNSKIEKCSMRINPGNKFIKEIQKNNLEKINFDYLNDFVCNNMSLYFNDIDAMFTKTIINSSCKKNKLMYEQKCKDVFTCIDDDKIESLVVATPKRGGNYKVSPFLISDSYLNEQNVLKMIKEVEKGACFLKRRKITFFIPIGELIITNALSLNNYFCEGVLREPYKENCDIIVFSKFIGEDNEDYK